jgi:helix-turn-helix protein
VAQALKKGTRVIGVDRSKLGTLLGKRYDSGESIRSLAASTGRSYGFVHRLLTESGIELRRRGGATRSHPARASKAGPKNGLAKSSVAKSKAKH